MATISARAYTQERNAYYSSYLATLPWRSGACTAIPRGAEWAPARQGQHWPALSPLFAFFLHMPDRQVEPAPFKEFPLLVVLHTERTAWAGLSFTIEIEGAT